MLIYLLLSLEQCRNSTLLMIQHGYQNLFAPAPFKLLSLLQRYVLIIPLVKHSKMLPVFTLSISHLLWLLWFILRPHCGYFPLSRLCCLARVRSPDSLACHEFAVSSGMPGDLVVVTSLSWRIYLLATCHIGDNRPSLLLGLASFPLLGGTESFHCSYRACAE